MSNSDVDPTVGTQDPAAVPDSQDNTEASQTVILEVVEDNTGAVPPSASTPDAVIPTSGGGVSLGDVVNLAKTA